jgi:hypothetical protein
METKIYNIDFTGIGFERYAFPKEVVETLDKAEGSYTFLTCCLGCTPEDIGSIDGYFINVFWDFFTLTPKSCEDMRKTDYNFLAEEGGKPFFDSCGRSFSWFFIPSLPRAKGTVSLSWGLGGLLRDVWTAGIPFFVYIFTDNADTLVLLSSGLPKGGARKVNEVAQPAPKPKPLEWLTDEQYEILALRLELLRRDFEEWCDTESLCYQRELFGNSEKFITACHDGTLLDSTSNPMEYQVLRSQRRSVLGLQGLGYMCDYPAKAEKILNMLKPYLDAVYDLPTPVTEFKATVKVEVNEGDSNNE